MSNRIKTGMTAATGLTAAGRLREATALIQSLLKGGAVPPDDNLIEGKFARIASPKTEGQPPSTIKPRPGPPAARGGLAETLRKIAAGGMPGSKVQPRTSVAIPHGAQFLALSHDSTQGSRDYRLYNPANRPETPMPLIVMLHGCTQTPEDFATGTGMNALAEIHGCLVAYPAQSAGANTQKCWNWFRPEDQGRGRGEPALIAGLVGDILRKYGGDPTRVYIAGLSAGGAAAAIIADAYPDVFSAVGVHSGLPIGVARDVPSAFSAMRSGMPGQLRQSAVPTIVFHGKADSTVHPANGQALVAQALKSYPALSQVTEKGASAAGTAFRRIRHNRPDGRSMVEYWELEGVGHAWSGGQLGGSYTDAGGPDASREMLRFFLQHAQP